MDFFSSKQGEEGHKYAVDQALQLANPMSPSQVPLRLPSAHDPVQSRSLVSRVSPELTVKPGGPVWGMPISMLFMPGLFPLTLSPNASQLMKPQQQNA